MKVLWATLVAFLIFTVSHTTTLADGGYVVQAGDTLASIAYRYGVSVDALAQSNGLYWNSWVYTGQWLTIPGASSAPSTSPSSSVSGVYTVRAGDTLYSIATAYGVSMADLQVANGLPNADHVFVGQQLSIPGRQIQSWVAANRLAGGHGEKWIDVNLTAQTVTAYEGNTPVFHAAVSTGTWQTPTVVGTFQIYLKYDSQRMTGQIGNEYWDVPNVPYVMYFYEGYALHGAYWHNNFGVPMSHGCVNLSESEAQWLYYWAEIGTKVVSHY
ncbi:MAG: LysM peptidoglycan-binding domain-containing protein [Chloroflexota bacterium]